MGNLENIIGKVNDLKNSVEVQTVASVVAFIVLLGMLVITSSKVVGLSERVSETEQTLESVRAQLVGKQLIENPNQCC